MRALMGVLLLASVAAAVPGDTCVAFGELAMELARARDDGFSREQVRSVYRHAPHLDTFPGVTPAAMRAGTVRMCRGDV